jgi:hypothetical protein
VSAPVEHRGTLEAIDQPDRGRAFRAVCSCGWKSKIQPTNACMGLHRRHVAAMRRLTT